MFLISIILMWFHLSAEIPYVFLHGGTFFTFTFNMLIMIILNFLFDGYNFWNISKSHSIDHFISCQWFIFISHNFWLKLKPVVYVVRWRLRYILFVPGIFCLALIWEVASILLGINPTLGFALAMFSFLAHHIFKNFSISVWVSLLKTFHWISTSTLTVGLVFVYAHQRGLVLHFCLAPGLKWCNLFLKIC